ncbi:MAG: BLUF domain-containing protein [Verrucomicrobiota bacterium]
MTFVDDQHSLLQIIYISAAVENFKINDLEKLLIRTRLKNEEREITGIILYVEGNIMQVIEGQKDVVESLFIDIENDCRHRHVTVMARERIERRDFAQFAMGFKRTHKNQIERRLPGFIEAVEQGRLAKEQLSGLSKRVTVFLRSFAKTTKLRLE